MVFPDLTSLFSKKKTDNLQPQLYDQFPELKQGQQYLQKRNIVQNTMRPQLQLIESLTNQKKQDGNKYIRYHQNIPKRHREPFTDYENRVIEGGSWDPADIAISYCGNSPHNANYGYCPPESNDLLWKKDGCTGFCPGPANKINSQIVQQKALYKDYMKNVNQYIANPPTGLKGQNVQVSAETGAATPFPPDPIVSFGSCNYLNVCAPTGSNLTQKDVVHGYSIRGETDLIAVESAANKIAAKYGLTCKSYKASFGHGPMIRFTVGGKPVSVQQNKCIAEGGDITVSPRTAALSVTEADFAGNAAWMTVSKKRHGGFVLLS